MLVDEYDKPILDALGEYDTARANRDYLRGLYAAFETCSPAFMLDTPFKRRVTSLVLEHMRGAEELLSKFEVEGIGTEALLFQTGYLTIAEEKQLGDTSVFKLAYPNREVKESLNRALLHVMGADKYRGPNRPIHLIGIEFSERERNISKLEVESV